MLVIAQGNMNNVDVVGVGIVYILLYTTIVVYSIYTLTWFTIYDIQYIYNSIGSAD